MRYSKFGLSIRPLVGAMACTLTLAAGCGPAEEMEALKGEETTAHGKKKDQVVYGTDDRQDVYAHPNATLRARAQQATVALMGPDSFDATNPNNVTFSDATLGEVYNLCTTERFRDDPIAAGCSGTLIDDDLVLTAGHCVDANGCANTRFVFNYYRPAAGTMKTVTTQDIFSCTSIVVRKLEDVGGKTLDYAILRLDRPATPRFTPAPVRASNTALSTGQNVAVIGCGSGVPFKIDSGGSVRNPRASTLDYFEATTDTFGGNSGSGVYETNSYTVAGILVRGAEDYVANGSCNVVNKCSETGCGGGSGEGITYVYPAIQDLCAVTNNGSQRLCSNLPPPPPPPANAYAYTASNTNNAQQNTTNKTLTLAAGDVLEVGTCGLEGATGSGDTFLRLYGPSGTQAAENDDSDVCGNSNSYIKYTVPSAGAYTIRAGCFDNGSCGGTVVWKVTPRSGGSSGSFNFSASNTDSAQRNTVNKNVTLVAGQVINLGTCTVSGASGSGDTYLRLYSPSGAQVAENDDSCNALSYLSYTVPAGAGGTYQIRAGCFSNESCSGTVAYTVQ